VLRRLTGALRLGRMAGPGAISLAEHFLLAAGSKRSWSSLLPHVCHFVTVAIKRPGDAALTTGRDNLGLPLCPRRIAELTIAPPLIQPLDLIAGVDRLHNANEVFLARVIATATRISRWTERSSHEEYEAERDCITAETKAEPCCAPIETAPSPARNVVAPCRVAPANSASARPVAAIKRRTANASAKPS
jgi:hypothetical protein